MGIMKPINESFRDWESHVFGYGYGTGEPVVIGMLKSFFDNMPTSTGGFGPSYDYQNLGRHIGEQQSWLMINVLCHADIIEYGTSPRHGWLTEHGRRLYDFVRDHKVSELVDMCLSDEHAVLCQPHSCNCGPSGYEEGKHCDNPFWR